MRLPFLRSKTAEADPPRERPRAGAKGEPLRMGDDDVVVAARTRARRRLVGAVVLLALGVIGFPILFDTQPRPLPLDTPIEAPRREGGAAPAPVPSARLRPSPVTSLPPDAGAEVAAAPEPAPVSSAPAVPAGKPAAESTVAAVKPPPPKPEAAAAPAPVPTTPPSAPVAAAGRFVVQVGAFTDAATLREARAKVEKLGLKTYTQVIEGDNGKPRTRVRLGPFGTRDEADAAASKLKRAGLPAAILTL